MGSKKKLILLVKMSITLAEEERPVLADPQMSRGLLILIFQERRVHFQKRDTYPFHIIGRGEKGTGKTSVDA